MALGRLPRIDHKLDNYDSNRVSIVGAVFVVDAVFAVCVRVGCQLVL